MAHPLRSRRLGISLAAAAVLAGLFGVAPGAPPAGAIPVIAPGSAYRQVGLSSDIAGAADVFDPQMVNSWGLASRGAGPLWVAQDGTSMASQYVTGPGGGLVRHATAPTANVPGGLPTGIVGNSTTDFVIPSTTTAATHVTASITGNLVAFGSGANGTNAVSMPGHVWTGLAIGASSGGNRLYAADFANNHIDVFDGTFTATTVTGSFIDATIPAGYAPHNIQNLGGSLFVTYAAVGGDGLPDDGIGNGFVRKFNTDGIRDLTFAVNNGALNSPWGVALAPATFGIFGGSLLVGNNGDGNPNVHAYNPTTGAFLGTLQDESGNGIVIDELWGLQFGNGGQGGDVDTLYFSAGVGEGQHGLLGALAPTTASATSLIQFSTALSTFSEGTPRIKVTVTRNGDVSGPATIRYATWDQAQVSHASQKTDYETNAGRLVFATGETTRSFYVLPVDDRTNEDDETVDLLLSNPTGTGVGIGTPSAARLVLADNDPTTASANPIDDTTFFVRQQYLDFLGRQPEADGLAYWKARIDACGANAPCRAAARAKASGQFFLSAEYQNAAASAFRTSRAAMGRNPLYGEYVVDTSIYRVSGEPAYFDDYVARPELVARYGGMTNTQYVDALLANTGLSLPSQHRDALIAGLDGATMTRAQVLRAVTRIPEFVAAEKSRAFVLVQYFGYLRRDAEPAGYDFWLDKLADDGGNYVKAGMVANFVQSPEYRQRFGAS